MQTDTEAIPSSTSGLNYSLHPLVLINISDHYTRTKVNATASSNPTIISSEQATASEPAAIRVVGCLLGQQTGLNVDISNSFEVNFDANDLQALDMPLLHKKLDQYKQTYPGLDVVGWYATGASPSSFDLEIQRQMAVLNEAPVFLLLDGMASTSMTSAVHQKDLPVRLFESELHVIEGSTALQFVQAKFSVATSEAERIGVDQVAKILPPGASTSADQLVSHMAGMHSAAQALVSRVALLHSLLRRMADGSLPFDPVVARQAAAFAARLPAADAADGLMLETSMETCDAMLSVLLAGITKGNAMATSVVGKHNIAFERQVQHKRAGKGMSIGAGAGGSMMMPAAAVAMGGLGLGGAGPSL